jgi:cytochrome c-type biogenesis protein
LDLSLSFIRGMLAAVNPCGFILLPTYLLYFLGLSSSDAGVQRAPVARALVVSAAVSAGFLTVFLGVGAIAEFFTSWVVGNAKYLTAVIGAAFVVLGIAMLFGYRLPINTPKLDAGGRDRTLWSMFVYGIAYAVASIGCTLPLFLSTLFGTADRSGYLAGLANVVAYGAGMALLITALTVTLAVANVGLLRVLRSGMQYVEMIAGALVLLSGLYLLWYFWRIDIQESTDDSVTGLVERWQTEIGAFLNDHWASTALVLGLIVGAAITVTLVGRRRHTEQRSRPHVDER